MRKMLLLMDVFCSASCPLECLQVQLKYNLQMKEYFNYPKSSPADFYHNKDRNLYFFI